VDAVAPAAAVKKIQVDVHAAAPVPVIGDAGRLQQVAWNLLSNAVKFTPAGGHVQVTTTIDDGHAELRVTDTGIGIPPAFLPFVFDKFRQADGSFTRQHGGLGLGLAIARHLIELHGGSVEALSAGEGTGATFVVRLPLSSLSLSAADDQR
jgi:signal transduction histidine kinase